MPVDEKNLIEILQRQKHIQVMAAFIVVAVVVSAVVVAGVPHRETCYHSHWNTISI